MSDVTVFVIDDDQEVRDALQLLMESVLLIAFVSRLQRESVLLTEFVSQ